jgi:hypothetical protein
LLRPQFPWVFVPASRFFVLPVINIDVTGDLSEATQTRHQHKAEDRIGKLPT